MMLRLGHSLGESAVKLTSAETIISLLLALLFVLGGLKLVPLIVGSDATPWPEAGIALGWISYRAGWNWWRARRRAE